MANDIVGPVLLNSVSIKTGKLSNRNGGRDNYMFFKKKVTMIEMGELVFFKSIECLRKSKLKTEFIDQEQKFKEVTLGYIIGTSTLHISPQMRTKYLDGIFNATLSFLTIEKLDNMKRFVNEVMELMRINLNFDMGIREYIGILTKKYFSDLDKIEYDENCYNMAYEDLHLYYVTLDKLFDGLSIDYVK